MPQVSAYAAKTEKSSLDPMQIDRREVLDNDIQIDIEYCGVCHSDIHMVDNDWGMSLYPIVPGHEIIGRVSKVGSGVSQFKAGDLVGVGCMVDSCRECSSCDEGLEQYCENGNVLTYSSPDPHGGVTYGGYSKQIVVDKDFVLRVPENLDVKSVAPLLCAGITTYSPLRHWKIKKGDVVGIVGLGGLGHMGVKFAHAMGAKVVMITTSPSKGEDAKALGADDVLISTDPAQMESWAGKFDFILNTIPVQHDINPYTLLLKRDATMTMVGVIGPVDEVNIGSMILGRKQVAGSVIGGIQETQEMLDFCGEHNITADCELINIADINNAYKRMQKSDVKYRFVIDMSSLV